MCHKAYSYFQGTYLLLLCERSSEIKLSKILPQWSTEKKFPGEASLRKVLSLHFDFIWNKFYVQNANAYAITNFLLYNLMLIKSCSACSKQNCKQCLFNVSNIDIIWSSMTTPVFIFYQFWTSYEIFLSLKYLFHFFVPVVDCTFLQEYWRIIS